jgi:hypothetical protein
MTIASTIKPTPVEGISTRAIKLLKGPLSYIDVFVKAMPDLWYVVMIWLSRLQSKLRVAFVRPTSLCQLDASRLGGSGLNTQVADQQTGLGPACCR